MAEIEPKDKRTPIIEFTRQLLPQPPKNSEPYLCLVDTLIFYALDENGERILEDDGTSFKEAWRQLIPECDLLGFQRKDRETNELEYRHSQHCFDIKYDDHFGWILKFRISHLQAKLIWKVLFPQVNFERPLIIDNGPLICPVRGGGETPECTCPHNKPHKRLQDCIQKDFCTTSGGCIPMSEDKKLKTEG